MIKPIDYKQGNSKWGSVPYRVSGELSTIKSAGCGPTAMADVLAAIISPYIDPVTCAAWARQHGYKMLRQGTSYSYFAAQAAAYGVSVRRINTANVYGNTKAGAHNQALQALQAGNWLIACMGKGLWTSSGHYVVAYGYSGGEVYINDPASDKEERACNSWTRFSSQVKYYWIVDVPVQIKQGGIVKDGNYRQEDFVREVQLCTGATIDGKAGPNTVNKTITVSVTKNRKHPVVLPIQKKLKRLGWYTGTLDCTAGPKFTAAVNSYQKQMLRYSKTDGEITKGNKMWRSMLGLE